MDYFKDKNIRHIFFDLDHTLWDFDKNSEIAFATIFKEVLPDLEVSDFISVYAPINQSCWKLYQNNLISHEELRYKRLRDSFSELQIEVSDALLHTISEDYIKHLPNSNFLFDGCLEVLEYLQQKYQLHIITNGFAEVQDKKLLHSGIHKYFESVTNSEMAGVKKPNPQIFEYALHAANANKDESVMIGDCLDADVNGALNFGMHAIFFNPNAITVTQPILKITNLVELKQMF